MPLLGDPDPDVRLVACSGLARAATPRAAEAADLGAVARLLPPERIIERLGAPWAVETISATLKEGPSAVADVLAGVAPCGDEVELDASLARALGPRPRSPRARLALAALLDADSTEVRISAARALGRVGERRLRAGADRRARRRRTGRFAPRPRSRSALLGATDALEPLERLPLRPRLVGARQRRPGAARARRARASRRCGARSSTTIATRADRAREQLALHAVVEEHAAA